MAFKVVYTSGHHTVARNNKLYNKKPLIYHKNIHNHQSSDIYIFNKVKDAGLHVTEILIRIIFHPSLNSREQYSFRQNGQTAENLEPVFIRSLNLPKSNYEKYLIC